MPRLWKNGLNWFVKQGHHTSHASLPGVPSIGQADTGRTDWERRLYPPVPPSVRRGWDDRQNNVGWMLAVMVDGVNGGHDPAVIVQRFTRVWVRIKAGEVAAGNVQPDTVALLEHVRRWVKFDG
jgi:hypothetical protein